MARVKLVKLKKVNYKVIPIPKGSVCAICGIKKPLDTCHIIPKRFLVRIKNIDKKLLDYGGKNTIILCKNHHTLLDRYDLSNEEMKMIWRRVFEMGLVLADIYGRVVATCKDKPELDELRKLKDDIQKHINKVCNGNN